MKNTYFIILMYNYCLVAIWR